uniref:Mitochondrial inner membrane protease subunit n=1 Tax=Paulinella chromatophora TaxID=39717 RepID=B1X588_PAUCH|nr:Peptidase S26A, signal peptidase I [Paulinella chromatophora]ACB43107.1 Peptidase S26A, signal peptidase I [Paulinella chromatophora]
MVSSITSGSSKQRRRSTIQSFFIWLTLGLLIRWVLIEPRWIPSGSMLPTLQIRDRIMVEKLRVRLHQPLPLNSIVIFRPPLALIKMGYDPSAALIKRIVGRPGDEIEIKNGQFWRNGRLVEEPWSSVKINYSMSQITVPEGTVMAMGDNRNASLDSHLWGPLPMENIIGTAVWCYWPLTRFGPTQ